MPLPLGRILPAKAGSRLEREENAILDESSTVCTRLRGNDVSRQENAFVRIQAILGILLISLGMGAAIFATQEKLAWHELWRPETPPLPQRTIPTVELADALRLFYSPETVIVDVREKRYYDYGHIEGALSIPFETLASISPPLMEKLKAATSIVVYCNAQSCGTSFLAARKLMDQGLDQVTAYTRGWGEWRSCRLPMTRSSALREEEGKRRRAEIRN